MKDKSIQKEIHYGVCEILLDKALVGERWSYGDWATAILKYLDSKGCVLKVDRELPLSFTGFPPIPYTASEYREKIIEAGYVATERLIEE